MNSTQAHNLLKKSTRIAVVRTDRLGDMVLTLPLCKALKDTFPHASIELITRSYCEPLLYKTQALDAVHFIDNESWNSIAKRRNYSTVFFPRIRFDEVYSAFANRITLRIGSRYRWYSPLLNYQLHEHRSNAEYHEAEYNLRMLSLITDVEIPLNPIRPIVEEKAREELNLILTEHGIQPDEDVVILHPGSGGSARDWSAEKMGELAEMITTSYRYSTIVTGTSSESLLCEHIVRKSPRVTNLCGKLNLWQIIALLERAKVMVANSTGVLHIASAMDVPVVGLYPCSPAISARRWGPIGKNVRIITPLTTSADEHISSVGYKLNPILLNSSSKELIDDMTRINTELVFSAVSQFLT
jgi:heptosyltransferase III